MPNEPTDQGGESRAQHPSEEMTIQIPQDSVHPALANAPHPQQTQTYPVNINGRIEQWDMQKLVAEAQTGAAGREKFQEAAETRKESAKALALEEDMKAVFEDGDLDAFRRVGAHFGVPGDEVEEIAQKAFGEEEDEDEDPAGEYQKQASQAKEGRQAGVDSKPVSYDKLSPDLQRVVRIGEQQRIDKIVELALDKDEKIAYNMEAHDQTGREAIRSYVDEKIRGRLASFNGDFGDGTRILSEVLPEIREHLEALGTPGQRTTTGLGPSPGGGDTEVYPKTLPDHVSSSEGDAFEQSILETMAYHQSQAERGKS